MPETLPQLFGRWGVGDLLLGHPGLALVPSPDARIIIAGDLCFRVQGPHGDPIADAYEVEIHVPRGFPEDFARVWETGGRIPESYHKLHDGSLCLGAPGELRLRLLLAPRLLTLTEHFVIPYLYGFSFYTRAGVMPFGELAHGDAGLLDHFADLFGVGTRRAAQELVRLAGMKRREANKRPCPCGSGWRLGRCHHRRVNRMRDRLGQKWLAREYTRFTRAEKDRAAGTLPPTAMKNYRAG